MASPLPAHPARWIFAQPPGLSGTLSGWQVGDTIDFVSTSVSSATISGSTLTITVSGGATYSYQLAGQEANTSASLQSDSTGGTDVFLTSTSQTQVLSSAYTVTSGQSVSNVTVVNGGDLILSGGTASDTTVSSGGRLDVLSGGVADPTVIYSGGLEVVSAGGTDTGAQISGGEQDVYGSAVGVTIFAGYQSFTAARPATRRSTPAAFRWLTQRPTTQRSIAAASNSFSAARQSAPSSAAAAMSTSNPAALTVGAQISGGEQDVYGTASSATVFTGSQVVEAGGVASDTTVSGGGEQEVYGTASGTTVDDGSENYNFAQQVVESGGTATDTTISGIYQGQIVYGTAIGTTVSGGDEEGVYAGGTTIGTIVRSSYEVVEPGGTASGTTLSGGQLQVDGAGPRVHAGGTTIGTIVGSGGLESSLRATLVAPQRAARSSTVPVHSWSRARRAAPRSTAVASKK